MEGKYRLLQLIGHGLGRGGVVLTVPHTVQLILSAEIDSIERWEGFERAECPIGPYYFELTGPSCLFLSYLMHRVELLHGLYIIYIDCGSPAEASSFLSSVFDLERRLGILYLLQKASSHLFSYSS